MQSPFTNTFFQNNREKLRACLPRDYPVVLLANGTLQRTADTAFPFQQESNFWYFSGINEPDLILVLGRDEEYVVLPHTNSIKTVFDGAIDTAEIANRSGIKAIYGAKEGWEKLTAELHRDRSFYTVSPTPRFEPSARLYANPAQRYVIDKLRRRVTGLAPLDISPYTQALRMRKQPAELEALRTAVRITTETIAQVRGAAQLDAVQTEYSLEAAITNGFRRRGATGHAYAPIVASGGHAATLHYVANSGILGKNELIVADVGAEYEHYAADITRTFARSKLTARQRAILDAVIDIQQYAASLLRPGVLLREYEGQVAKYTGKALYQLKLTANAQDIHAIRTYFPHASSHFLGLDVHDVGEYNIPLEESMVLTCEPGIYIPEENIGVRIEDDLLITSSGNQNLSSDCVYDAYVL